MQTHTKEPWGCNSKGQIHSGDFHDSDGAAIICRTNNPKDAYRIKACVNACEGIPIEMLEGLPLGFMEHAEEIERLKEVNAQLLDALTELLMQDRVIVSAKESGPNSIFNAVLQNARAAISAATKTEPNQQTEPDYDNPAEREADQREADAPTPYDP